MAQIRLITGSFRGSGCAFIEAALASAPGIIAATATAPAAGA